MANKLNSGLSDARQRGQLNKDAQVQRRRSSIGRRESASSLSTSSQSNSVTNSVSNSSTSTLSGASNSSISSKGRSDLSSNSSFESQRRFNQQRNNRIINAASKAPIPIVRKAAQAAKYIQKIKAAKDKKAGFTGKMFGNNDNNASAEDIAAAKGADERGEEYEPEITEQKWGGSLDKKTKQLFSAFVFGITGACVFLCLITASAITGGAKESYLASHDNPTEEELAEAYSIDEANGGTNSSSNSNVVASGTLNADGTLASNNNKPSSVYEISSEPEPWAVINYWDNLNKDDFIYPVDKATNLPLGAWPMDYKNIPTQLSGCKLYQNAYIWPATPEGGVYEYVYEHLGIDIMSDFGTPIYSPVDGTLVYSEWGHTTNKGSDETAYSVTISPDTKVTYNGVSIDEIFMTHMSGIRYRCSWGECNRKVTKGELVGFVGTAAGGSTDEGYASHLHMTFYPEDDYGSGLYTPSMESFYSITAGTRRSACE